MSTIINATTTNGVVIQPDNSGSLVLQTNSGTTALTIDTSQRAAFVAGTAAAPAITTSGDTNTGIFFPAADTIAFAEGGAEAMRIDSSGNVGIGTTSPARKLDISGASAAGSSIEIGNTNTQSSTLAAINTTGTTYGYSGVGGSTIWYYGNKTVALGTDSANPIQFITNATERMRIDSSGNLLVGTTSAVGSSKVVTVANTGGNAIACWSQTTTGNPGFITFGTEASYTERGYIYYNRGAGQTQLSATSDYRAKVIDGKTQNALAKISAMQVHDAKLKWAEGASYPMFIAHELQEVAPWAVTGEKNAVDENNNPKYQVVAYESLVATLTAAIQELKAIVDAQAIRIETLEAK